MAQRYTGLEKHGPGHRGVYRVGGVKYKTATYPTMKAAFEARTDAVAAARRGEHVDPRRSGLTVDQWWALWQPERRIRPVTAEHDRMRWANHISPYLGSMRLDGVSPHTVDKWLRWLLDNGRTPSTSRKALVLLKTALTAAVRDRRLAVSPCAGVVAPRVVARERTSMARADFERVVDAIPTVEGKAIALLGGLGGLRWSEIMGLQRQDFNPLRQTLTVTRGRVVTTGQQPALHPPKGGKPRVLPLHPRLVDVLNEKVRGLEPEGFLFTSRDGGVISGSNYRVRVWLVAFAACGLEPVPFHSTRHSYATWLLQGGADLATVRDLCGHASITTTAGYLHSAEDEQRAAMLKALG